MQKLHILTGRSTDTVKKKVKVMVGNGLISHHHSITLKTQRTHNHHHLFIHFTKAI